MDQNYAMYVKVLHSNSCSKMSGFLIAIFSLRACENKREALMSVKIMHTDTLFEETKLREHYISLVDRLFLMRFHPRAMILDSIGTLWGGYFLWYSNWPSALLSIFVFWGMGLYFTRNIHLDLISQTTLGKIALLHKHPINLALNLVGLIPLVSGLWQHSGELILLGFSVIILGHFFGWSEVNSKLRMN